MSYILALDQGTTSSRAIVLDHDGRMKAVAQKEIQQIFPRAGWVEHDPCELWTSQVSVAMEALDRAHVSPREIIAAGIANQRETTIIWDRETGRPICNAIVWQDRRTAFFCDQLKADGCEPMIQQRTGLVIDAYFSATKIAWILDHVPGARERATAGNLAFGTVDSWLVWKLTGGRTHATDVSNASRTMLFNLHTGQWDEELLRLFRIPANLMPEVRSSSELYGTITAVRELENIPVTGIAGDQQAALFGQLCLAPGLVKNTYGTGCFMLQNTGEKAVASRNRLLTTVAWRLGERTDYALEGSIFAGGSVVQWLRDRLGLIRSAEDIEALAGSVSETCGVYLVPAFAGLGAPHWDPYARGLLIGLTHDTTAAHIARAALEGIAYQVADLFDAMHADAGPQLDGLKVDGGMSMNNLLMQFQADLLGIPLIRPTMIEATALGAAYLAGLAVAYWRNVQELSTQRLVERRFEPRMRRGDAESRRERWRAALERAKGWEARGAT